ncbi:hypothetical protein EJB05_40665, partial [Eragrostis curvula]
VWKAKAETLRTHVEAARRRFRVASGELVVVIGAQGGGDKDVLNLHRAQAVTAGEQLGEPRRLGLMAIVRGVAMRVAWGEMQRG